MTVKRGLDVRDFALAAFGGSGPLQICRLIDLLGLAVGVVPANPGNLSAFGLLTVDVRNDYVQTFVRDDDVAVAEIATTYERLEQQASAALRREGFDDGTGRLVRQADLRYAGQAFEVRVDAPDGPVGDGFRAAVVSRFHDAHEATYGYCYRDNTHQRIEWVNLRVSGVGPITHPTLRHLEPGDGDTAAAHTGQRDVCFDGAWHATPLFARDRLRAGDAIAGPAVIEEFGSTVPLPPGFSARVDDLGNLVITSQRR
jgi:N-methylhydantoinase A